MRDLVIVGAGGFARETAAAVRAINGSSPGFAGSAGLGNSAGSSSGFAGSAGLGDSAWNLLGFLDDNPALHGTVRSGVPVIGGTGDVPAGAAVVVCVGNPHAFSVREKLVMQLGLPEDRYATIVHPAARIGAGCTLGPGTVLLAGAVLTADVAVGAHVAVMPQAVLTHDDVIGDYATICAGVLLGGSDRIEPGAYLGAGCLVRESVVVGSYAQIGLGAVVLRDVPPGQVWVGNPARYLRDVHVNREQ
jgi:sugar O-acyltransferase (sialic acid O-acetyltransferase NeuD family)